MQRSAVLTFCIVTRPHDTDLMNQKPKIRVIKKTEMQKTAEVPVEHNPRQTAREIVATVSDWVAELKARKEEETRAAIEQFLPQMQTN